MRTTGKLHLLKLYLPTAPNAGWSWLLKRGRGREGERKRLILFYVYMHLWHVHVCTDAQRSKEGVRTPTTRITEAIVQRVMATKTGNVNEFPGGTGFEGIKGSWRVALFVRS